MHCALNTRKFHIVYTIRDLCVSELYFCLSPGAEFVHVAAMSESDNEEDDKVYVFFTERAQEAEGAAGKVLYSRVARVCKVSSSLFSYVPNCTCVATVCPSL